MFKCSSFILNFLHFIAFDRKSKTFVCCLFLGVFEIKHMFVDLMGLFKYFNDLRGVNKLFI